MVFIKDFFEKDDSVKKQQTTKRMHEKLPSLQRVKQRILRETAIEHMPFVCGIMSCAKLSLYWSVIHYQVTFECHSGCGLDTTLTDQQLLR